MNNFKAGSATSLEFYMKLSQNDAGTQLYKAYDGV